jgi:hypothetical protein
VSTQVDGEAVVLDLEGGVYYGLNPAGARIWSLVQAPQRVRQVEAVLLDEYEVEPEQCRREMLALLEDLLRHGLIQVLDEAPAG